jgi:hypothetical protein
VKGNRRKSTAYRASFIIATKSLPKDDKALIPNYYYELDLIKYMKFWVKLASITQIPFKEMAKLRVASSVLPLSETLNKSSSGHFFLVEKNTSFNST